jgi:uncharacterized membrane protein YgcG
MAKTRLNRKKVKKRLNRKKPSKSRDRAIEILDELDDDWFEIGLFLLLEVLAEDDELSDIHGWVETGEMPQWEDDMNADFDDEPAVITGADVESESAPEPAPAPEPEPISSPDPEPSSYESSYGGGDSGGSSYDGGGSSDSGGSFD